MKMDQSLGGFSSSRNLGLFQNPMNFVPRPRFGETHDRSDYNYPQSDRTQPISSNSNGNSLSTDSNSPEDVDFSDTVLNYISQILMEEEIDEKIYIPGLQAAEKPFYEALGQKYPPSPETQPPRPESQLQQQQKNPSFSFSQSSYISSLDSPCSFAPDFETQSVWQFQRGVEEANRFLPDTNDLFLNLQRNESVGPTERKGRKIPEEEQEEDENDCGDDSQRSKKQAAVYIESTLRSKMFDLVLLCSNGDGERHLTSVRETLRNEIRKATADPNPKSLKGKNKTKKKKKNEVVDLRSLSIQCAQAVAADDRQTAAALLSQLRRHSSPFGDGNQRLTDCFADGLEARLAGTGSHIYKTLVSKRISATVMLKAYLLYLAACPFRKISHFSTNRTILNRSANAGRLHVIDFGILYGFQWPTFIQRLSARPGGPPRLKITGVEFPQPGFRPAERVEETGRRLKAYADSFGVPFEYNAIAKKWETVTLEELKIEPDEFVAVNCLYQGKNLLEESVTVDSPRNMVLNLVKRVNPDIFVHGIVNGSYNAPFFVTRFREALFHFSAIFDMLETIVPRSDPERIMLEKEIFGREALNVIACEGWERVERPETYKQWQVRIMRAGFVQTNFGAEVVKRAKDKVRSNYHRDFVIDEDSGWLLQGWKGRIIFALSLWKPA